MSESWKTEKFRKSVIDKLNKELEEYRLKEENPGINVEKIIYEKASTKVQYLGYVAKLILEIRHMVCIQDAWLQNRVTEIVNKRPPKLRKVLSVSELAKFNLDVMKLKQKIAEDSKTKINNVNNIK